MMHKYKDLGAVFKNLRTNRHISLKQLSDDTVSISQLSRFERGESDISVSKFLTALDKMNVEVREFIDAANNYQQTEQIKFVSALIPLEYERNIAGFKRMMAEEEAKFKAHPDVYRYHLNVILLQSFVCKCDESVPFPKEYVDQITDYLFTTEDWNIQPLLQDETDMYKRTIYLFLSGYQLYMEEKMEVGVQKMKSAIRIFELLGCDNLANNYKIDYDRLISG